MRPREPVPATGPGAKRKQKSRSARTEHPKTPPAMVEQQPSNIAASRERPQPGGEQPRGGGGTSGAAMDSPQSIGHVCLEVAMLAADR